MLGLNLRVPDLSVRAAGAAAFDPASLFDGDTGAVYDLSDGSTVFQERTSPSTPSGDGDPIGTLNDISGNGNHISAPSDAQRPTYSTDGYAESPTTARLLRGTFTLNQTATFVLGVRMVDFVNGRYLMDGGADQSVVFLTSGGEIQFFAGANLIGAITVSNGEDFVLTARASGATSRVAKNTGSYATGDAGTTNPQGISFFSRFNGTDASDIRLYRAILIGRDLTDAEIADARTWCAAGYGGSL